MYENLPHSNYNYFNMFELASICFIMVFFLVQLMDISVCSHVRFVGRQDSVLLTMMSVFNMYT
jgi:hypothetical protein